MSNNTSCVPAFNELFFNNLLQSFFLIQPFKFQGVTTTHLLDKFSKLNDKSINSELSVITCLQLCWPHARAHAHVLSVL